MAGVDLELIRRYFESLGNGDVDVALAGCTEDFTLDRRNSNAPYHGITRGRQAAREAFTVFYEAWDSAEGLVWEPTAMRAIGEELAAVGTRIGARGAASGIEIEANGGWLIATRGDKIAEAVLHQSFGEAMHDARRRLLERARLYFVCDGRPGGADPEPLLEAALRGGADLIQLREKAPRCADELVALAEPFRRAADRHGVLFILNDEPALVEASGADGVHVGQADMPVAEARRAAGPGSVVGLSTHSHGEVDAACAATGEGRPDQISVGPVWETPTKEGRPETGLELIRHAATAARGVPWFAIGGIDESNVTEVAAAGAGRVVVVRAIRDAPDPEAAARALRTALEAPRVVV